MTPVKGQATKNQTVGFSPYKEITPAAEKGQLILRRRPASARTLLRQATPISAQ